MPASDGALFRLGHGGGETWRAATEACLGRLGEVPADANVGFVYITDHFAANASDIAATLREATGIDTWSGTAGIGICVTGREYFDEPAVAVLVGVVPDNSFYSFNADDKGVDKCATGYFGVVHCDPRNPRMPETLAAIAEATGGYLVGGLTASRGAYPQIGDGVTDGGISGILFSDAVGVVTGLSQGCSPIGPAHEVTACEGNVIIELDRRPAFEVFCEDIGDVLSRDLQKVAGYIFAALPVSGVDKPDYLVRNIMGLDPQAGLIEIAELLQTGDRIMFCRRDRQSAQADLQRMLDDLRQRAGETAPRAAVYFSCLGRGPNMFGEDSGELKAIQEALGDVPLVGFFCNGEISNARLYTYTGVLSLIL